jgi:transcriptional regulator with XRE-family HTH domain
MQVDHKELLNSPDALGREIRRARQAHDLTLEELAARTGLSLRFLSELERGKSGASVGRVMRVLRALGLTLGTERDDEPSIALGRFPNLRLLAWQRGDDDWIAESEALSLLEANWRFVEPEALLPREQALIKRLKHKYGHGVLNLPG